MDTRFICKRLQTTSSQNIHFACLIREQDTEYLGTRERQLFEWDDLGFYSNANCRIGLSNFTFTTEVPMSAALEAPFCLEAGPSELLFACPGAARDAKIFTGFCRMNPRLRA